LIDCVVAPVDHTYEVDVGAVKVTVPPVQKVVAPEILITGVTGSGFTVTTVGAE
jgi:hypothetical protein